MGSYHIHIIIDRNSIKFLQYHLQLLPFLLTHLSPAWIRICVAVAEMDNILALAAASSLLKASNKVHNLGFMGIDSLLAEFQLSLTFVVMDSSLRIDW